MYLVDAKGRQDHLQQLLRHQFQGKIMSSEQETLILIMKPQHMSEEMVLLQLHAV